MDMLASIQLYHFLEALVDSVDSAVESALNDSADELVVYIPSSIDVSIRCSLDYYEDGHVYVTPSNALVVNYYGKGSDAIIKARLLPIPRQTPSKALASTVHAGSSSISMQDSWRR